MNTAQWEIVVRSDISTHEGVTWIPLGWTVRRHGESFVFQDPKHREQHFIAQSVPQGVAHAWVLDNYKWRSRLIQRAVIVFGVAILGVALLCWLLGAAYPSALAPFGVYLYESWRLMKLRASQMGLRKHDTCAVDLGDFDLENNWGSVPMDQRVRLAKAEIASGIQGLARAEGVRWWEDNRRSQMGLGTKEEA